MSAPMQYGSLKYQSPETRALGSITEESFTKDASDQSALWSRTIADISYQAQYMRKMQAQVDHADENVIQQIQGLINDIIVIMGGQGDTGFDFGDLKYVITAWSALYGFADDKGNLTVPVNLFSAAQHFMENYVFPSDGYQQMFDQNIDNSIAQMLEITGNIPVVNQAAEQFAVMISQMRDNIDTQNNLFASFFNSFGINAQNPLGNYGDFFNGLNSLYAGLQSMTAGANIAGFNPIFTQMARWDQRVIDAIYELSYGDISGMVGLISTSQLTMEPPNLQQDGGFGPGSIIDTGQGWSVDLTVGRTTAGAAKHVANGHTAAMPGNRVSVYLGEILTPEVYVSWSGVAATGDAFILQIQQEDGTYVEIAKVTNPAASSSGWVHLTGSYTVTSPIFWVKMRLVVTSAVTAGTVWFDDAALKAPASLLPQSWIDSLDQAWIAIFGDPNTPSSTAKIPQASVQDLLSDLSNAITTGDWTPLLNALYGTPTVASTIIPGAVPALDASKVTSGQFAQTMVDNLDTEVKKIQLLFTAPNMVLDPTFDNPVMWTGNPGASVSVQAHSGVSSWQLTGIG